MGWRARKQGTATKPRGAGNGRPSEAGHEGESGDENGA